MDAPKKNLSATSSAIPDNNNVSGAFAGPADLELIVSTLKLDFGVGNVGAYTSGYNGAQTIHVESEIADFEGYSLGDQPNADYAFHGAVAGADSEVIATIQRVFERLSAAGVKCWFEVYDSSDEAIYTSGPYWSEQGAAPNP